MAGDFLKREPQLPLHVFHAFRDERPKEEKWELIDGVPVMMPPPTITHQMIVKNLLTALTSLLEKARPDWLAVQEIGLLAPNEEQYNPEPDVTVIDALIRADQIYAERFHAVAEIVSPSDKPAVLEAKLAYYKTHAPCRWVALVEQAAIRAVVHERRADGPWLERRLLAPSDILAFPELGPVCALAELYRNTPLAMQEL